MAFAIGFDLGSSSIKAALIEVETGKIIGSAGSPDQELPINSPAPGMAEQDPQIWWEHSGKAAAKLAARFPGEMKKVKAVGIAYQMHGLVMTGAEGEVLHPAIIWCDSRAVETGEKAFREIGEELCLKRFLNSPGNFTASKLKWIQENRKDVFKKIEKIMLPGDWLAYKMTGKRTTTPSGLSEGIFWDFTQQKTADLLLKHYAIPESMLPDVVPAFSIQGELHDEAAKHLNLPPGIPVSYRAGDQPNNAYSLGVLNPGELAATAGTSGVVYAVGDKPNYDPESRVNTFVHVNHTPDSARYGTLLCLNGCGITYSWLRKELYEGAATDYFAMDEVASALPIGSEGLCFLPFGNGAERSLGNRTPGGILAGLQFNLHNRGHIVRAAQEGVAFALNYGMNIMREMGIALQTVKAGKANLFLSPLFREIFASVSGTVIEIYDTDGAGGAARGAAVGAGLYSSHEEGLKGLQLLERIEPSREKEYTRAYGEWLEVLEKNLGK